MSLIYKSLQQVAQDEATPRKRLPPMRYAPKSLGLTKRLAVFLGVVGLLCAAAYGAVWWLQGEVQRLESVQDMRVREPAPVQDQVPSEPAPVPPTVPQSSALPHLPRLSTPPKAPAVQTKIGIEDLAKPTLELEDLFTQRAQRNQKVMELDRQVAEAWSQGDVGQMDTLLTELQRVAGAESVLPRKWRGVVALQRGDYNEAERIFAALMGEKRADAAVRINFVQALVGQDKHQAARQEWERLQHDYPDNPKVRELGRLLR